MAGSVALVNESARKTTVPRWRPSIGVSGCERRANHWLTVSRANGGRRRRRSIPAARSNSARTGATRAIQLETGANAAPTRLRVRALPKSRAESGVPCAA